MKCIACAYAIAMQIGGYHARAHRYANVEDKAAYQIEARGCRENAGTLVVRRGCGGTWGSGRIFVSCAVEWDSSALGWWAASVVWGGATATATPGPAAGGTACTAPWSGAGLGCSSRKWGTLRF